MLAGYDCRFKKIHQLFKKAPSGVVIVTLVVGKIYIEVHAIVFGPGVQGYMRFTQADHSSEAFRIEIMVYFTQFVQAVFPNQMIEQFLYWSIFFKQVLLEGRNFGNDV